uniref:Superoxide dismutase n=2 Tax=Phascolosoma esculenta TaxID=419950 RepID=D2J0B2_9ANNE|nr:mitochondrial Mn-superoxide dismutase precursor [Phascolosoma esculenta]AFP23124.1 mitochondrial Mn-superoxide dismutase precursor [Phascolosoma esculenta]
MLSRVGLISRIARQHGVLGCVSAARKKHTLPDLPYDFNALEPYISHEIMQLHYQKHHQTYVNNLNAVEEQIAEATANEDVTRLVALQAAFKFNGGGHINHSIFWQNLSPEGGEPTGDLLAAIIRDFDSLENLKSTMSAAAVGVQGSGWAWLGYCKNTDSLQVATCANQDPLQGTTGLVPLFGIDVWEHAYYLQYKNVRPDYVKAIWNVANWKDVAERFAEAHLHAQ